MLSRTTRADLFRLDGLSGLKGFLKGLRYPGFRYIYIHRQLERHKSSICIFQFLRFLKRRYKRKYGFEICGGAQIGEGLYISDHSGHVVIGPTKIGKNCNIGNCVTIGRSYKNGKIGRPEIGDKVWIGTGVVIVGEIKIGNNVLIAPNSFVNFDVPDNSLVIGNPGIIKPRDNPVKNYIHFTLEELQPEVHISDFQKSTSLTHIYNITK
jgi:serine O-acetyltransferase